LYVTDQIADLVSFQQLFEVVPEPLTSQEKQEWKSQMSGLVVSSDAFFPFFDNIQRVKQSGVDYVAAPSGSVNDDKVIQEADALGICLAFTDFRLFHH
jgi:phosphoribosylaminoimidazolecarboxamide formyltransferase/IMP cyclohydrolase